MVIQEKYRTIKISSIRVIINIRSFWKKDLVLRLTTLELSLRITNANVKRYKSVLIITVKIQMITFLVELKELISMIQECSNQIIWCLARNKPKNKFKIYWAHIVVISIQDQKSNLKVTFILFCKTQNDWLDLLSSKELINKDLPLLKIISKIYNLTYRKWSNLTKATNQRW